MLNTKILSIVTALVMVAGLGAIAADSAAPVATTCHQKICKTNYMPVNKDPKALWKDPCKTVKNPVVWKSPCTPIVKDPVVWKAPCKHIVKDPVVWKAPCTPIVKNPVVWKAPCKHIVKNPCHSTCKNHTPTTPINL